MNTADLKALLRDRVIIDFDSAEQDFEHGLRLTLQDVETGELGILAIEPCPLALPDEVVLNYSYQVIQDRGPVFVECLYDFSVAKVPDRPQGLFT